MDVSYKKTWTLWSAVAALVLIDVSGVIGNVTPVGNNTEASYPTGDPRNCKSANAEPKYRFEVLPGGGWDNLRNKEMGMVMKFGYSQCKTTDDGRYLIPDSVYTIPLKRSKVETYAELIEHWENYTSTLSRSINAHAGLHLAHWGISGSFSDEYESVKSKQHYDKSVTTRIQARYLQYSSKLEPDTEVNEVFRKRLLKIAAALTLNQTKIARYESQLLVRDFGTHVITSMDVGAALVQLDEVNVEYVRKYASQKSSILASASASFFGVFDFGTEFKQTTTTQQVEEYKKQRTSSHIMTYGGPVFRPRNYTGNDWSQSVENDLVAMDKSGDPIYFLATQNNMPGVPQSVVYDVYEHIKKAVEQYYEHNTHRGCTLPNSPNFSFQANVNDGSCKAPLTNFTFGGVYQECKNSGVDNLCDKMTQVNPQTGGYSCPTGYEAVALQTGTKTASRSERKCHRCWLVAHCCNTVTYNSLATYTAYWCAATGNVAPNSGYLFGGLYTPTVVNVLTQSQSCPLNFYPLTLLSGLTICVSDDYELGYQYSLPFAGFFSCNSGNPLALKEKTHRSKRSGGQVGSLASYMAQAGVASYPHTCPEAYSQHLAVVDNGCSINYCVKTGALSGQGLPNVQRPPFMEAPRSYEFTHLDESSMILSDDGSVWTSLDRANDVMPEYLQHLGLQMPQVTMPTASNTLFSTEGQKSASGLSGGMIAVIAISATLVCVVVATLLFIRIRRGRRMYRETDPWSNSEDNSRIAAASAASRGYSHLGGETNPIVTTT